MTCSHLRRIALVLAMLVAAQASAWAQSRIGVLGIESEVAPIERRLGATRDVAVGGYTFRLGTLAGREVVVGRSAAGKVNAAVIATLLVHHFKPAALFFTGTAGAVDLTLRPGDVVIGSATGQWDVGLLAPTGIRRRGVRNGVTGEREPVIVPAPAALLSAARQSTAGLTLPFVNDADGRRLPRIAEGVIVTGDVFLTDSGVRDELRTSLGAAAVEMEGAAMTHVCRQFSVPCLVVRSVTDRADGRAVASYEQYLELASENAAAVVAAIIGNTGARSAGQ